MKKQVKSFGEFTMLNEGESDRGNYLGMATAFVDPHAYVFNRHLLNIEYNGNFEVIDWEPGSENDLSNWIKVFKIVDKLGANPNSIKFKYMRERTDGKGHMRASKIVGRNILNYEEPFDFNNYYSFT